MQYRLGHAGGPVVRCCQRSFPIPQPIGLVVDDQVAVPRRSRDPQYRIDDVIQEPGWDTIDMVKHDDQGKAAYPARFSIMSTNRRNR